MKSDIVSWPKSDSSYLEKWHCVRPGTYCGLIFLFSTKNGEPLAILNDGTIQHMRVGGGAGIGAKHLARANASVVGWFGRDGKDLPRGVLRGSAHQARARVQPDRG
jgi:alanine dehydrogenase